MRFLVDECTGVAVARWLVAQQHDVFSVYEQARGISDQRVIELAYQQQPILITNDKDFGEKVYREQHPHVGIVLLRLTDERAQNKIQVLQQLLTHHDTKLDNAFVVVTEKSVRFAKGH